MERNQFWIFMALLVAIGIGFEVINDRGTGKIKITSFGKLEALLEEGRPVYTPESAEERRKTVAKAKSSDEPKLAGLSEAAPARPAAIADKPAPALKTPDQIKKEEEEKKKKAEEEKKKKENEKKKKKKKKIKGKGEEETKQEETPKSDDDEKKKDSDNSGAALDAGAAGYVVSYPAPFDGLPRTVEEWKLYLLTAPSYERTAKFIKYYQTGLMSEAMFYEVTEDMLVHPNSGIREMGLLALGATPSVRSFALLTDARRDEREAKLKTQADTYLKQYARLENLRHLAGVIGLEGEPAASQEALRLLRISAESYLKDRPPTRPTGSNGGRVPATSNILRYFNPFFDVLKSAQRSRDSATAEAASQTLSSLQGLLQRTT